MGPPKVPGRKPLSQILLATANYERVEQPLLLQGPDYLEDKRRLQDKCASDFGCALPTVMRPKGMPVEIARRRVTFAGLSGSSPASRETSPKTSGLTSEQERLSADIVQSVKLRQRELAEVEARLEA